jgi:hypothetical protein
VQLNELIVAAASVDNVSTLQFGAEKFAVSNSHRRIIADGKVPIVYKRSLQRSTPKQRALLRDFILHDSHTSIRSWGTRTILVDDKLEVIPVIERLNSIQTLYEKYMDECTRRQQQYIAAAAAAAAAADAAAADAADAADAAVVPNAMPQVAQMQVDIGGHVPNPIANVVGHDEDKQDEQPSVDFKPFGRTVFAAATRMLTSSTAGARGAVDHVMVRTHHDNIDMIKATLPRLCAAGTRCGDRLVPLQSRLKKIERFLRGKYRDHTVLESDNLSARCINHSIHWATQSNCDIKDKPTGTCDKCDAVWKFYIELDTIALSIPDDVLTEQDIEDGKATDYTRSGYRTLIRNMLKKTFGFMAHIMRSNLMRKYINNKKQNLTDEEAIITLDFKQKFERRLFREAADAYYGKSGMSWHCSVVQTKFPSELHLEAKAEVEQPAAAGLHQPLYSWFYDHVIEGTATQDYQLVIGIIENLLEQMKVDYNGRVKRVYIVCDGASYYSCMKLTQALALLRNDLPFIAELIHNEPGDGKGIFTCCIVPCVLCLVYCVLCMLSCMLGIIEGNTEEERNCFLGERPAGGLYQIPLVKAIAKNRNRNYLDATIHSSKLCLVSVT